MAKSTVWSISASNLTMKGSDPPNSKMVFLRYLPAVEATILPTRVDPVKLTP